MPTYFPTLPMTREQALARVLAFADLVAADKERVYYNLGMGGRDPSAPVPYSKQSHQLDCTGWCAYGCGYDRKQRGVPGGYINSSEIVRQAHVEGPTAVDWFEPVPRNEPILPMDLLVYGWQDQDGDGDLDPGHGGIVVGVRAGFVRGSKDWYKYVDVIDCNPHNSSQAGRDGFAVRRRDASLWRSRIVKATGETIGGMFVRYTRWLPSVAAR